MKSKPGQVSRQSDIQSPGFIRGFQWDLARQMERVDFLLKWIPRYAGWGYNQMNLYLEDAFDFPSVPGVGRAGALSPKEMASISRTAVKYGIQTVPIVPLMGHAAYLTKVPALFRVAERRNKSIDPSESGQICPLHRDTPRLAKKLLGDVAPYCTSGMVHVSLDESFSIGECPKCRAEVKRIGLAGHFANHVLRLHAVCAGFGLRMAMWGDMLYYVPEAIPLLPKDIVVYDWYYYPFKRLPRVEIFNFAEVDLTGLLTGAGIEVYGCPNNGPFMREPITPFMDRLENIRSWWRYGAKRDTRGIVVTSWCSTRTSPELNSIVDAAAASLWLGSDKSTPKEMLANGIRRVWDIRRPSVTQVLSSVEKYQYSGTFRSQTYGNWRALANGDSPAPFRLEESHFRKLGQRTRLLNIPSPFRECLTLRHYLARKDLFLSSGAGRIFQARRKVAQGNTPAARRDLKKLAASVDGLCSDIRSAMIATRALWRRSRPDGETNATGQMLKDDRGKAAELKRFLKLASRDPARIWRSNPLTGQWHLIFWVRNFAPAWQRLVVQKASGKAAWQKCHELMSMEFTADAGTPRANFRRHHTVAVSWTGEETLRFRFGVRAFGRLEVYDCLLTDGVTILRPQQIDASGGHVARPDGLLRESLRGAILGAPAPKCGFPPLDSTRDEGWVEVSFRPVA